jgi:hypothetical protein
MLLSHAWAICAWANSGYLRYIRERTDMNNGIQQNRTEETELASPLPVCPSPRPFFIRSDVTSR